MTSTFQLIKNPKILKKPQNPQKTPKSLTCVSSMTSTFQLILVSTNWVASTSPTISSLAHLPGHRTISPDLGCSGFWFRYRTISPTWDLRLEVQDQGFGILLSMDLDVCNDKN